MTDHASVSGRDDVLSFGLPSKGRLQEQCAQWLADVGFTVRREGGDRGYTARLAGVDNVEVLLLSPREIAIALLSGTMHVGVTGLDLLEDLVSDCTRRVDVLTPLGFGGADCVVAVPQSWVDVHTMADLDDVAGEERHRTGEQLRVATKYLGLTRRFFAEAGIADYRIIESHGATEVAPTSGTADVIVDITSTGATLEANHLKVLDDGVILKSEAVLAASKRAVWTKASLGRLELLMDAVEARARGKRLVEVRCAADERVLHDAAARFDCTASQDGRGVLCDRRQALAVASYLRTVTGSCVEVAQVDYFFSADGGAYQKFAEKLGL